MNAKLEALRILVAAGVINVQGGQWNEQLLEQAGQIIVNLAGQIMQEQAQAAKAQVEENNSKVAEAPLKR